MTAATRAVSETRRIWRLAGPIMLSNVTVPLLGAVDTAVVGRLPEPYFIGAVAIGAMIFSVLFSSANFLRTGTTGPTAQARGAGETDEVRAFIFRALLLAWTVAAAMVLLQGPLARLAFAIVEASEEVEDAARTYYAIRIFAAPASLAMFAINGWFLGQQNARIPLLLQVTINGLNMVLDVAFVLGLGWGVAGVAAATIVAEYVGLALGLVLVLRRLRRLPGETSAQRILDAARLRRMLAINRDLFLRTVMLVLALSAFLAESAKLGDLALAANQVLYQFILLSAHALDGFADAAEALVGEAVGRRDRARMLRAVRTVMVWGSGFAGIFVVVYGLAGEHLVALITTIPAVREEAARYLTWAAVIPMVAVWAYNFDGIFFGATRAAIMRNMMALSFGLYLVLMLTIVPAFGNHGLWAALLAFFAARGASLAACFPALRRAVPDRTQEAFGGLDRP